MSGLLSQLTYRQGSSEACPTQQPLTYLYGISHFGTFLGAGGFTVGRGASAVCLLVIS
jgi:hypothetical protein